MLFGIWCTSTDCIYCFNNKLLLPRISRCMALAILSMPSFPNICSWWPHLGQTYTLMFWTRPSTGTSTLRNISAPFLASNRAMSCGVDTITAPEKRINVRIENNYMWWICIHLQVWYWVFHKYLEKYLCDCNIIFRITVIQIDQFISKISNIDQHCSTLQMPW